MNQDFSELIEYLDEKFTSVDEKFVEIGKKFIMISEKFTKAEEKLDILQNTKADKSDINELMNAIDSYAKRADTYFQEMVMLAHKVDRHEKWIRQIAEKLGVKLDY